MRLKNVIKRIFGRARYIDVIADKTCNANIPDGYAGGSLADDNLIIISNSELPNNVVTGVFANEHIYYSTLKINQFLRKDDIKDSGKDLIGPFSHIINVFYDSDNNSLINKDGTYNSNDSIYQFYQWHQEEVDYLVELDKYATVCSVFITGSSVDNRIKRKNVEMCVRGLAEALSNHGVICNGIIANKTDDVRELLQSAIFLSSRYGQIMTGEVLMLNE